MRNKLYTILALLFLLPSVSYGAIAFDTSVDGGTCNPCSSQTTAVTATTTANTIMFAYTFDDTGGSSALTGITFNGVSFTRLGAAQPSGDRWVSLWYLLSPASGTHNAIVSAGSSVVISSKYAIYANVKQVAPEVIASSTAAAASGFTQSLTTLTDNDWTTMAMRNNNGSPVTPNAGTTERSASASGLYLLDSNGPKTPAGSTSLGATLAGSWSWGGVMAAFAPFGGEPASTRKIRGVGISR